MLNGKVAKTFLKVCIYFDTDCIFYSAARGLHTTFALVLLFCVPTHPLKQRSWIGPSQFIPGTPTVRYALAIAAVDGKIFLFGGLGPSGNTCCMNPRNARLRDTGFIE